MKPEFIRDICSKMIHCGFVNTGNSIEYTGIRWSETEILGSPIEPFEYAFRKRNLVDDIQFIGIWDFRGKFKRLCGLCNDGKSRPISHSPIKSLNRSTIKCVESNFPEWPVMMKEQYGNENSCAHDYINNVLLEKHGGAIAGLLVFYDTVKNVYKKIVITAEDDGEIKNEQKKLKEINTIVTEFFIKIQSADLKERLVLLLDFIDNATDDVMRIGGKQLISKYEIEINAIRTANKILGKVTNEVLLSYAFDLITT